MAPTTQEQEEPILNALASALVASTPEHWESILLGVTCAKQDAPLEYALGSPQEPGEPGELDDDVKVLVEQLRAIYRARGHWFRTFSFEMAQTPTGGWSFAARYTWPD